MPPRFAVYRNRDLRGSSVFPMLVDVQSELLEDLNTRVVIPLARSRGFTDFPLGVVMPSIELAGQRYVLVTPQLAAVPRTHLGPHSGSVADQSGAISTALDVLLRGF
jgi:toxin CcdB